MFMIHPLFEGVADRKKAEIFSSFLYDNSHTFASGDADAPYDGDGAFPPEPAHFNSVVLAYIEDGALRVQRAETYPGLVSPPDEASSYETMVGSYQSAVPELEAIMPVMGYPDISTYYLERVRERGDQVLAAYMIGKVASSGALIDALASPKSVSDHLPQLVRNMMVDLGAEAERTLPKERATEVNEFLKGVGGGILRLGGSAKEIGPIAASRFLPEPSAYRAALGL